MGGIKPWIQAARLRTLPLAVSGIIAGSFLAYPEFNLGLFLSMFITAGLLQILSNFANDLGDYYKGADENRTGEKRLVSSGEISSQAMKRVVILFSGLSILSAFWVIYLANLTSADLYFFVGLAVACVLAAITYTVGKKAYGYSGLGDVFVFLFFGWVSAGGSYFMMTKNYDWLILLPASAIGLFSAAVLNLNNLRDHITDKAVGKHTLVVKLGFNSAKTYHTLLLVAGNITLVVFALLKSYWFLLGLIPLPLSLKLLSTVRKCDVPAELDGELKKQALSTLLLAVFISIAAFLAG